MARQLSPVRNTSDKSTNTSNTICAYPLAIIWSAIDTPGRLILSLIPFQTVTPPGTNASYCCLTSPSSVTSILPLSYWDKIKFWWRPEPLSYILMHPCPSLHLTITCDGKATKPCKQYFPTNPTLFGIFDLKKRWRINILQL
jgi:hypothetical protein